MGRTRLKSKLCQGPALAGSRGYPQDAQHWRDKTCETSLDRAKSQDEQQERERESVQRGCLQQGLAILYFLL